MPFTQIPNTEVDYALLAFEKNGSESRKDPDGRGGLFSEALLEQAKENPPSHVFLFSHGWKGDVVAAKDQYNRWIKAMLDLGADREAMGPDFRPMWIGLHWPSLPWGDEELGQGSFDAQGEAISPDRLVEIYLDRLDQDEVARPLLETIIQAHYDDAAATELPPDAAAAYQQLAQLMHYEAEGPSGPPDADGEPFDAQQSFDAANTAAGAADFGGGFMGGILSPLRQLSYWTMKKRARSIGESGMHQFVAGLMDAAPAARIHLMGHSFGCIVMSSILGGAKAAKSLPRPVDSLALVQGAVSLWAFAGQIPFGGGQGYFHPSIRRGSVRGPVLVTTSVHDRAVGNFYPLASAASLASPDFDPDKLPKYGAIGAFGIRGLTGVVEKSMLESTGAYNFQPGRIYNLESSRYIAKGSGSSGAHSDIDGPEVAHALWQAATLG